MAHCWLPWYGSIHSGLTWANDRNGTCVIPIVIMQVPLRLVPDYDPAGPGPPYSSPKLLDSS